MRAMILAAGRGKRLRPLTDTRPKPLLEAGGRSLLEYHLRALAAADIRDVVINTSWLAEQIHATIGDGSTFGMRVVYSDEGANVLETGGGIVRALPLLGDEPFLVVNGDIWCDYPFAALPPLEPQDIAHIVLVPNPPHNPGGDFALVDGRVRNVVEDGGTFSGIAVYRPEFFAQAPDGAFPLAPLLRRAAVQGSLRGEFFAGHWWDVGTSSRLDNLDAWLRGVERD